MYEFFSKQQMFIIRRAVIDIGRKSAGYNFRLYCNARKPFKNESASSARTQKLFENDENNENKNENNDKNSEKQEEEEQHKNDTRIESNLMIRGRFQDVTVKNRESFLSMVRLFVDRDKHRRYHVEFIYAALKHMEEFGVQRDIEVYKEILNVMPKGKMVARNMFQAEFMHYPKQQECAIFLLDQMEYNGSYEILFFSKINIYK